jgi:hypothetical protein
MSSLAMKEDVSSYAKGLSPSAFSTKAPFGAVSKNHRTILHAKPATKVLKKNKFVEGRSIMANVRMRAELHRVDIVRNSVMRGDARSLLKNSNHRIGRAANDANELIASEAVTTSPPLRVAYAVKARKSRNRDDAEVTSFARRRVFPNLGRYLKLEISLVVRLKVRS